MKHTDEILGLIRAERERQDAKWGKQNHPNLCPVLTNRPGGATPERFAEDLEIPTAARAKQLCRATCNWGAILVEEVSESIEAAALNDLDGLETELVQVAAVAVAQIECIRRQRGLEATR